MSNADAKVEFISNDGIIEVRYFDNPKDDLCRHWKLPEDIARDLISWWIELKKNEKIIFPLTERSKKCEFAMYSEKYVDIKTLDCHRRPAITGWSLPVVVVERLVIWQNGKVK